MPTVDLDAANLHYSVTGPDTGRPVVFVHGYAMGGSLWGPLATRLGAAGPALPRAHLAPRRPPHAVRPGADRTLPGVAAMVDAFLDALDLDDVVLVGNDTGGLVAQLVAVAPRRAARRARADQLRRLRALPAAHPASRSSWPRAPRDVARGRPHRWPSRPSAAGPTANSPTPTWSRSRPQWVRPALDDPRVAEDLRVLTASLHRQTSLDVAARLGEFTRPVLVAWSADDALLPGRRRPPARRRDAPGAAAPSSRAPAPSP